MVLVVFEEMHDKDLPLYTPNNCALMDRAGGISSNHQCRVSPAVSRVVPDTEVDTKGTLS
jgi:hypothetical protein